MRRTACLLVILTTGACAAQSWSFDHVAGATDAGGDAIDDVEVGGDQSLPGQDAALETGSAPDAGPVLDTGPGPEAAQGCSVDGDCPSGAPLCSQPAGLCIRCSKDVDCTRDDDAAHSNDADANSNAVCNASTGACVQCTSSSTCSASSAGTLPYCDTVTDRCVRCLKSTDCENGSVCQLATHTCTRMF